VAFTLGGHTASVNVVKWGGGGLGGRGVLYTGSSDRTVRVWDAENVSLAMSQSDPRILIDLSLLY
jgi:ribosome assembly protein 4